MKRFFFLLLLSSLLGGFSVAQTSHNQWSGKKVAFLGDSMTDKRTLGPNTKLYWEHLKDLLSLEETYVYGISGHQWNRIYNQAESLWTQHKDDVDAILIFAGTNDYNADIPLGTFFEEEMVEVEVRGPKIEQRKHRKPIINDSTFCGRLNRALFYLKEHYPDKQIVMMTPIHRGYAKFNAKNVQPDEYYSNKLGLFLESYVETMKQAAAYWSIPVIDLYSISGIVPNVSSQDKYIAKPATDRLHPSAEGQYRLAKLLQYQLQSLPVDLSLPTAASAAGNALQPGDSNFQNPILRGDYPDPSIVRHDNDYYMVHSAFDYLPGLTVFHSRDLIHWEPISVALNQYLGSVWAPDICYYQGKYYIYFTVNRKGNFVVYADDPRGPWSKPIDLHVGNIDPCHVVGEDGQRWLFLSGGRRVKLSADGLSVIAGTEEVIYNGWEIPSHWLTEGKCLEGPKVKKIGDYFYYLNAEGGTAGPPTSHMVIVARSKSVNGPWENMPSNPLIHTYQATERWWSKGHGSLIDAPDGSWWIVYHAYENDFLSLGRQTLLEPIEITSDLWLTAPSGTAIERPMPSPKGVQHNDQWRPYDRLSRLNEFRVGLDWKFYKQYDPKRIQVSDKVLTMKAQGSDPASSAPMMFVAGAHSYEIEVEIETDATATAGLVLYYNADFYVGTGFDHNNRYRWRKDTRKGTYPHQGGNHLWLKICNDNQLVTGYYSYDGQTWYKESWGMEISGYQHNTLYDFQSVLPGLFVYGKGEARFKNFKYREWSAPDPNFHIYLCFGQSNMEGNARIELQDEKGVDARFLMMAATNDSLHQRDMGQWYQAVPPLCRSNTGLTPIDYFGRRLTAQLPDSIRIGIINVAVGGCRIEAFMKDSAENYGSHAPKWMLSMITPYQNNPYSRLIDMARLAQREGVIKGILMHQGESNTNEVDWPDKVKSVYETMLSDLQLSSSEVPFLVGEVLHQDQGGRCASMNQLIDTLPQVIPTAHIVSSSHCPGAPDSVHFNATGYRMLGQRYADTMLQIFRTTK